MRAFYGMPIIRSLLLTMRKFVVADRMSEKRFRFLSRFSIYTSGLAIAFGVMVLTGWIFHIQALKGLIPGQVPVKANTGVCFVLIGTALWLAASGAEKRFTRFLSSFFALVAGFIGLLSFLEYWYGWDLGLDQLLFTAGPDDIPGSVRPGLMSPVSAADFFLLGTTIALLEVKRRWSHILQGLLPTIAAVLAVIGSLDFVLDPRSTHTHIAPMTAWTLFLCSFAVLCAPERPLGALLISATAGGLLCRRLLPSAILIPIAIAWLRWKGQQIGFYSDWTGVAIMTVSSGVLLAGLTVWTAFVVDRSEADKGKAEVSTWNLAAIVTHSNDAIIGKTLDGIVTSWNPGAEAIYGYSAEEMIGQSVSRIIPPDRRDEFQRLLQRLRSGETIRHYETERIRTDGQKISVSVSISPLKDAKGTIVGASTITRDITERKKAEEELRRVSRYSRSLIEASLDPLVTISKHGKITDVNEATEKAIGLSRDRLIGSDFSDYFTQPEKAREGYGRVFEEGSVRDYPLAIRSSSGAVIDVLYNAAAFKGPDGEVDGVFAAARDITERKRAEDELRRVSHYSRSLIEASLDPLVTISKEGKITDVNEATEKATGISRDRLIGSDFSDYFTEPGRARAGYQQVFEKGFVCDYPLSIRNTSGAVMEVVYNATVFKEPDGKVEGIFAAARDITERKHAEEALNRSESRYRSLVTATAQIVWTTNRDGEVIDDMPMWRAYTGMSHQQLSGPGWLDSVHPDDRNRTEQVWTKAWRNRERYETEYRIRSRDGEYRWFAVRGVPVLENDATVREWVGTCTDITERKIAEEEVHRLNDELEQRVIQRTSQLEAANKELEAFTYSVSHDLRAPLRHISGFSKILSEEFSQSLPPDAQHHVQRIQEGTRRMGELVDDLLNLGRVGRRELSLQVAGLRSIVDDVIASLKSDVGDRHVEWKIGDLPYVECDTSLMQQVFHNLLSNAVKFTRPRANAVIEIGQEQQNGRPAVYVRDNGVGFSMKYADKLFGVFQRLHRSEDFEGTGVGLATVQRIVQKHGGRIWAEGELDGGATFYFTLGTAEADQAAPTTASAAAKA